MRNTARLHRVWCCVGRLVGKHETSSSLGGGLRRFDMAWPAPGTRAAKQDMFRYSIKAREIAPAGMGTAQTFFFFLPEGSRARALDDLPRDEQCFVSCFILVCFVCHAQWCSKCGDGSVETPATSRAWPLRFRKQGGGE